MTNENKNELLKATFKDNILTFRARAEENRVSSLTTEYDSLKEYFRGRAEVYEIIANYLESQYNIIYGDEEHEEVDK